MVTTRSAEKRAAQQNRELALRTRALYSSPTASPSVNALKKHSTKSKAAQEAFGTNATDLSTAPEKYDNDDKASHPAATEDPNGVERSLRNSNPLKRSSSEDLEATNSQKASDSNQETGQQIANRDYRSGEGEDEDAPPEIVSSHIRTPKRKPVGNRGSSSRKKAKLDKESSVPVLDTTATGMNIGEPHPHTVIPGESSIAKDGGNTHTSTEAITGTNQVVEGIGVLQPSPNRQRTKTTNLVEVLEASAANNPMQSLVLGQEQSEITPSNIIPLSRPENHATLTSASPSHSKQVLRSKPDDISNDHRSDTALKRQQETLTQRVSNPHSKADSNLPPRSSTSKSEFRQQLMQNRPNFRMTNTWAAKRKKFVTSVSPSALARPLNSIA